MRLSGLLFAADRKLRVRKTLAELEERLARVVLVGPPRRFRHVEVMEIDLLDVRLVVPEVERSS